MSAPVRNYSPAHPSGARPRSFTFLATLLLLLAVSCAIVIRSLIIRRRFRRRYEEALAAGIILPQQGIKRRDFGAKPEMSDSWLAPAAYVPRWTDFMVRFARSPPAHRTVAD